MQKIACMVSAVLCEMISFEKAGSEFRRVRFVEHLVSVLSVCTLFSTLFLKESFVLFRVRILQ